MSQLEVRKLAASRGERHYQGRPCKMCSGTRRYTINGKCCACASRKALTYYHRTKNEVRAILVSAESAAVSE